MPYFGNAGFIAPSHSHAITSFILKVVSLGIDEVITLGEDLVMARFASREINENVIVISEVLSNIKTNVRNLREYVGFPDSPSFTAISFSAISFNFNLQTTTLTRIVTKVKALTDTIGISEVATIARLRTKDLTETVVISEALTRLTLKVQSLTETVTISEALTKVSTKFRALADTITIGESLTKAKVVPRSLTQTITIGEALTHLSLKIRALAESIIIGESLTRASIKSRAPGFPESITIGEALIKTKKTIRALADTIMIGETLTRVLTKTRAIAQTITIGESLLLGKFKSIFINEVPVIVTEQAIPAFIKKSVKNLAETVSIGESLTRTKTTIRSITQSISIGESLAAAQIFLRNLADTIIIGDSLTRLKSITRSLAQSITLSDVVTRSRTFVKSITETVSISDALTSAKIRGVLIVEAIVIADFATATRLLLGAPRWIISGQSSDFLDSIENLVKTYVNSNWTLATPALGTNTASQAQIDNFAYDGFRTYYIKVREIASDVQTRRIRFNTYEFETPIEFDLFSRRLSKGESFQELDSMLWELVRIFGTYQHESMFGVQGVTFERITPLEREKSAAQTIWSRRLRIILHYYKTSTIG